MIKKKLTALIAVLLVCVMLFPTAAFAYAPDEESTPAETQTAQSADAAVPSDDTESADESESGEDDALPFDTDVLTTDPGGAEGAPEADRNVPSDAARHGERGLCDHLY